MALRRPDEQWIELSVENEGDALPANRDRMFEAFVSTRTRPENLGIGLFVARSIARNHGGTLIAEDLEDATGARFVLRLPAIEHQPTGDSEHEQAAAVELSAPPATLETNADE